MSLRLTLVMVLAAACSEYAIHPFVADSPIPDVTQAPTVEPYEDVTEQPPGELERTCEKDAVVRLATFEAPQIRGCPWSMNGNLERRDEFNQARVTERWELPIPLGATLCAVELVSQEDALVFDDHIALTLDDALLIGGGSGYPLDLLDEIDGITRFDWERIKGSPFEGRDAPYVCLGGAEPCVVPGTERPGPLEVAFDDGVLQDLLDPERTHELALHTFGDNDDSDCSHSAFTLDVRLELLE